MMKIQKFYPKISIFRIPKKICNNRQLINNKIIFKIEIKIYNKYL